MKKIGYLLLCLWSVLAVGCTKYDFDDTGLAKGVHATSMWGYFESDPYNYSLLMPLIRRAGVEDYFQGKSSYGDKITFFAITNHSIRRYFLQKVEDESGLEVARTKTDEDLLSMIGEMDIDEAKDIVLSSVLGGQRLLLDEFAPGVASTDPNNIIGQGGKMYTMASGKELWIYSFREAYEGVPKAGRNALYLVSTLSQKTIPVASHNIQTQTGVVHSLQHLLFTPKDF